MWVTRQFSYINTLQLRAARFSPRSWEIYTKHRSARGHRMETSISKSNGEQ